MDYIEKKNQLLKSLKKYGFDKIFTDIANLDNCALVSTEDSAIVFTLDDSGFNNISYNLGTLDINKKEKILELFNSFNAAENLLTFYLIDSQTKNKLRMIARAYYFATDSTYDSDKYVLTMVKGFELIEEYRSNDTFMKIIHS